MGTELPLLDLIEIYSYGLTAVFFSPHLRKSKRQRCDDRRLNVDRLKHRSGSIRDILHNGSELEVVKKWESPDLRSFTTLPNRSRFLRIIRRAETTIHHPRVPEGGREIGDCHATAMENISIDPTASVRSAPCRMRGRRG